MFLKLKNTFEIGNLLTNNKMNQNIPEKNQIHLKITFWG